MTRVRQVKSKKISTIPDNSRPFSGNHKNYQKEINQRNTKIIPIKFTTDRLE